MNTYYERHDWQGLDQTRLRWTGLDWAIIRLLHQKMYYPIVKGLIEVYTGLEFDVTKVIAEDFGREHEHFKVTSLDVIGRDLNGHVVGIILYFFRSHLDRNPENDLYIKKLKEDECTRLLLLKTRFTIKNLITLTLLENGLDDLYIKWLKPDIYRCEIRNLELFDNMVENARDEWSYFIKHRKPPLHISANGLEEAVRYLRTDNLSDSDETDYMYYEGWVFDKMSSV